MLTDQQTHTNGDSAADEATNAEATRIPRPRGPAAPASTRPGDQEALARQLEPETESRRAEIARHRQDEPTVLPHMDPGPSLFPHRTEHQHKSIRPFLTRNRDKISIGTALGVFALIFVFVVWVL